jgi:hypothetical protein
VAVAAATVSLFYRILDGGIRRRRRLCRAATSNPALWQRSRRCRPFSRPTSSPHCHRPGSARAVKIANSKNIDAGVDKKSFEMLVRGISSSSPSI